ncbi:MAG: hypothetical protein M0R17_08585 [Candidatus Omnitrophica bacterium]|nr:hypothetical protein [Candidatus Omnitrophota bacterium]
MTIRELTTSIELNEEVRTLMIHFWESYDKLWIDMDNLTAGEFRIRQHDMWEFRNKAMCISGDIFLISLYGLEKKAEILYGRDINNLFF